MYETFYHLNANPFRLTPDPGFCFRHRSYDHAWSYLLYAINEGEGCIVITGRPGTGKTTLIEVLLKELKKTRMVAARIAVTNVEAVDLLRSVAYAYSIDAEGLDKETLLRHIERFLVQQRKNRKRVLLFIDEAQGLARTALEELRLLADLQSGAYPLLQIFLIGQESLKDMMHTPDMEQLQQRVIVTCHLEPLNFQETRAYMEHRLCQVNWQGDPELTGAALLSIYQYSKGIPRHVNKMGSRLLLYGVMENKHVLDKEDVRTVAAELRENQLAPLEHNQTDHAKAADSAVIPGLEDGSISLADLALGMTMPQSGPSSAHTDKKTVAAVKRPILIHDSEPPDKCNVQHNVVQHKLERWLQTDGMEAVKRLLKSDACQPVVLALDSLLRLYTSEAARISSVMYTWKDRSPVPVAPLVLATLSTVMLLTYLAVQISDHRLFLTGYRMYSQPLPSDSGVTYTLVDQSRNLIDFWNLGGMTSAPLESTIARPVNELDTTDTSALNSTNELNVTPSVDKTDAEVHKQDTNTHDRGKVAVAAFEPTETTPMPVEESPPTVAADQTAPPPVSRKEKIAGLLSLGLQSRHEDRLLIPEYNSAYFYYQQVLVLEPGNDDALNGIERIMERYIELAERSIERGDDEQARRFIARGLRIHPGHSRFLALQDSMNNPLYSTELEPPPSIIPSEQEPYPADEPTPKSRNILSRIKAFFTQSHTAVEETGNW